MPNRHDVGEWYHDVYTPLFQRKTVLEKTDHDLDFLITDQNTGLPLKIFLIQCKYSGII